MCLSLKRRGAAGMALRSKAIPLTCAELNLGQIGTDVIVQGIVSKEGANQWLEERGKK